MQILGCNLTMYQTDQMIQHYVIKHNLKLQLRKQHLNTFALKLLSHQKGGPRFHHEVIKYNS